MELQNLSYLVQGYEKAIKELTEKKKNLFFVTVKSKVLRMESSNIGCYPVKKDGYRALIRETGLYINYRKAV